MGASLPIKVEASGPGVDSVTLWEDDRALNTLTSTSGATSGAVIHETTWTAITPGPHVLYASAHGKNGTAHSAPIGVNVAYAPGTPRSMTAFAPKGTTIDSFARAHGIDPSVVSFAKPSGTSAAASVLTTDTQTFAVDARAVLKKSLDKTLHPAVTPPTSNDSVARHPTNETHAPSPRNATRTPTTTSSDPNATKGDAQNLNRTIETTLPPTVDASSSLTVDVDGCSVLLSSKKKSKAPLSVYQATRGSVGFTETGTIQGDGKLTINALPPGTHVFLGGYADDPTSTAPVSVTIPEKCLAAIWKGNASLIGGILTIPKATDSLLIIYLSVDGQPAVRIPSDNLRTFRASTRHIDVTADLPTLRGDKIHLEVWKVSPNGDNAQKFATGDANLPDGMTPADLIGESGAASLSIKPTQAKVVDTKITGTWSTRSARPDRVLWQVLTQPLSTTDVSMAPPGLVASGVSLAMTAASGGEGAAGTFDVPISSLVLPKPTPVTSKPVSLSQLSGRKPSTNLPTGVPKLIPDTMSIDTSTFADTAVSNAEYTDGIVDNRPVISGTTYFLRVVPFDGTSPLGGASASVRFDGVLPTFPPQIPLHQGNVMFGGGRAGNPDLAACVRVTAMPWKGYTDKQLYSAFFPNPGTYCPGDWSHSSSDSCWAPQVFCDVWDATVEGVTWLVDKAAKVWDVIAMVYNKIVDTVVTILAKLNPYCLQAAIAAQASGSIGFSKDVQDTAKAASDLCEKVSKVATKAVVSAVMASFGLPPELPTSEQLEAMAKGDLTEIAVAYLENLGVPCEDLTVDAQTAGAVSDGVKAAGGSVPPGTADGVDVCRDAIGMVMDQVENEVKVQLQTQIAASTGLPLPFQPIDGFEFTMEPRGAYTPPQLAILTGPAKTKAPIIGVCTVGVAGDIGAAEKFTFKIRAFRDSKMVIRSIPVIPGAWQGSTVLSFNPVAGYTPSEQNLQSGTPILGRISSDCLGDGKDTYLKGTVGPALGRWKPGEEE